MTVFDEAIDILRALKQAPWENISIPEAMETLQSPKMKINDFIRSLGHAIDPRDPSNLVGPDYPDEVRRAWEEHGVQPVMKKIFAAGISEPVDDLIRRHGNIGDGKQGSTPYDSKGQYFDSMLNPYDPEGDRDAELKIVAVSRDVGEAAINRQIRKIRLEADEITKDWRVISEGGTEYYQWLRDYGVSKTLENVFEDADMQGEVIPGYLDQEGGFFRGEKRGGVPISDVIADLKQYGPKEHDER